MNLEYSFDIDIDKYEVIGFHATSSTSCYSIETYGFLPDKIFSRAEHDKLIAIAKGQMIDTGWYEQWLWLRSVTFTREQSAAFNHIKQGSAGGQGLKNISELVNKITLLEESEESLFLRVLEERIQTIKSANPVVYAVDLSHLGPRLDPDRIQPFYYFRWDTEQPLPQFSEIDPSRIIAKVSVQV